MARAARTNGSSGLGARMKAARIERDLGLRALALQVGMSASSLSEFEHGKSVPGPARLKALSQMLEVPLDPVEVAPAEVSFDDWRVYEPVPLSPVVQAALEIFTELGYHGSTMRMIADRSGLSVAGVYHYVESKQELLSLLLGGGITELAARCAAAEADGRTPEQRLANLTECLVRFHLLRRRWPTLAATELRSLDAAEKERLIGSRRHIRERIQAAIVECRDGSAAEVGAEETARAIATMCVAIADWHDPDQHPAPPEIARQYVVLALAMAAGGGAPSA